jgi:hypothetical protein
MLWNGIDKSEKLLVVDIKGKKLWYGVKMLERNIKNVRYKQFNRFLKTVFPFLIAPFFPSTTNICFWLWKISFASSNSTVFVVLAGFWYSLYTALYSSYFIVQSEYTHVINFTDSILFSQRQIRTFSTYFSLVFFILFCSFSSFSIYLFASALFRYMYKYRNRKCLSCCNQTFTSALDVSF